MPARNVPGVRARPIFETTKTPRGPARNRPLFGRARSPRARRKTHKHCSLSRLAFAQQAKIRDLRRDLQARGMAACRASLRDLPARWKPGDRASNPPSAPGTEISLRPSERPPGRDVADRPQVRRRREADRLAHPRPARDRSAARALARLRPARVRPRPGRHWQLRQRSRRSTFTAAPARSRERAARLSPPRRPRPRARHECAARLSPPRRLQALARRSTFTAAPPGSLALRSAAARSPRPGRSTSPAPGPRNARHDRARPGLAAARPGRSCSRDARLRAPDPRTDGSLAGSRDRPPSVQNIVYLTFLPVDASG